MTDPFNSSDVAAAASAYYDLGFNVLPQRRGTKHPTVAWQPYQTKRVPPDRLGSLFYCAGRIWVVLGKVSGGLACRDYDLAASYEAWAKAHPDLAALLPTTRTKRGYGVYFLADGEGVHDLGDGEMRLSHGGNLLPPSYHPDGPRYTWITPPSPENLLHLDDLSVFGFINSDSQHLELDTETSETTENTDDDRGDSVCDGEVVAIIEKTLPREPGTRHRRIFDLARHLQSSPRFSAVRPRRCVQSWRSGIGGHCRVSGPSRLRRLVRFLEGVAQSAHYHRESPLAKIFDRALRSSPPMVAAAKYAGHRELQLLAALCRELQRAAGDGPIFLSCRKAGELLGLSPAQAGRWLWLLNHDDILRTLEKGGQAGTPRRATRFRYLGD